MSDHTTELPLLYPLITNSRQLRREAAKRRKPYITISVDKPSIDQYLQQGWEKDEELTRKTRLKRIKPVDERLENRLWYLLFRLSYTELNEGRNFQILIRRKGAEPIPKQIDVFAKDDETVIVAECKGSERLRKKSLQKDIEEGGLG